MKKIIYKTAYLLVENFMSTYDTKMTPFCCVGQVITLKQHHFVFCCGYNREKLRERVLEL